MSNDVGFRAPDLGRFRNRSEAGERLARALARFKGKPCVVLALPRGGVPIGKEVAKFLGAELSLAIPRKIGHPESPEYAIAAVTEDGDPVCNPEEIERVDPEWYGEEIVRQRQEARRRRKLYMGDSPRPDLRGKTAILADDGIATGLTMKAALLETLALGPDAVVVAVPVVPRSTQRELADLGAAVVALETPEFFRGSVGSYYDDFSQVDDAEVVELLRTP